MSNIILGNSILSNIKGSFSPTQLSARLFMDREDIIDPENFLIWFHERFHYLQSIFTPYGHLKWAAYRTVTSNIIDKWIQFPVAFKCNRKLPIAEYIKDDSREGTTIAYTIWAHDIMYQIYNIIEKGIGANGSMQLFRQFDGKCTCPKITLLGEPYYLKGIDIFESYAKFEEAMLSELITEKSLDESINPEYLNKEYYSALYYFVENLGVERLIEFPIACELALATSHIPSPESIEKFYDNAPNWRFIKIVDVLKSVHNLPKIDVKEDNSFFEYSNAVLLLCGYDTWDSTWNAAEKYAKASDLTMAQEMLDAINYKKTHPWMLSYSMRDLESFTSIDFNRFGPYFTIANEDVMLSTKHINETELIMENHLQALVSQICGHVSEYCLDTHKLMCGYTYMGMKICPHYINGECDGYIDQNTQLPEVIIDKDSNIQSGCTFEMLLNMSGISIRDIDIGNIRPLNYSEIETVAKKYAT